MSKDIFKIENQVREQYESKRYYRLENDKIKIKECVYFTYPLIDSPLLQINHARNVIIADVYSRYLRLKGRNVLFSVGCDDIGSLIVNNNVNLEFKNSFKEQYKLLDIGFDKEKEILTSNKKFIKFMQEIFIDLFKKEYIDFQNGQYYLNIKPIKNKLISQLKKQNDSDSLKHLGYYRGLLVDFKLDNSEFLELDIKKPEYIFGISFIAINPEYEYISSFIIESEEEYILEYLDNENNQVGVFTGAYAINPITNEYIPIIITREFAEDIHIGIPSIFSEDGEFASGFELEYQQFIYYLNGSEYISNNSKYNDFSLEEVKMMVYEELLSSYNAIEYEDIENDKIIISKNMSLGIAVPIYKNNNVVEDYELPVLIDDKNNLRLLKNGIPDVNFMDLVFNENFISSCINIAIKTRTEVGLYNYDSWDFCDEYGQFNIKEFCFYDNYLQNLYCSTLNLITKIKNELEITSVNKITYVSDILDENNDEISRINNNLVNIPHLIKSYGAVTLRSYIISFNCFDDIVFDENDLINHYSKIEKFIALYNLDLLDNCEEVNVAYSEFIAKTTDYLQDLDYYNFSNTTFEFIDYCNDIGKISAQQARGLLIVFSIVAPSLCEYIYKEKFDAKTPLLYESWPEK